MSIRVSKEPSIILFVERTTMEAWLEENIRGGVHESFATKEGATHGVPMPEQVL
jgi:hypothetical protein